LAVNSIARLIRMKYTIPEIRKSCWKVNGAMVGWTTGADWSADTIGITESYIAFLTIACFMVALSRISD
jgi:hypothetical protein